jgi:cytochrome c
MNWRILMSVMLMMACKENKPKSDSATNRKIDFEKQYIRKIEGADEKLDSADIQRGKVLIAYSDCSTCHTEHNRAKGPAFEDIAKRYPTNSGYIALLAQKIIVGGSGAWGYPVMSAHPDLSPEDAEMMVKYILSLEK